MKVKSEGEIAQSCPTLHDPYGLKPTRLPCPWDFPGKNTGVGQVILSSEKLQSAVSVPCIHAEISVLC